MINCKVCKKDIKLTSLERHNDTLTHKKKALQAESVVEQVVQEVNYLAE